MMRRPCASVHDGPSWAQNVRVGRALTRPNRLPVGTTTYMTALRTEASAVHSRAILPLPIQSTGLWKTSIEGDKKVARLDTRSAFQLAHLSIEWMREDRHGFYR